MVFLWIKGYKIGKYIKNGNHEIYALRFVIYKTLKNFRNVKRKMCLLYSDVRKKSIFVFHITIYYSREKINISFI